MNRDRNLTPRHPVQQLRGRAQQTRHDSQSDVLEEEDGEAFYPQRPRTSVRRYDLLAPGEGNIRYEFRPQIIIPRRSSAQTATGTASAPSYTEDVTAKPKRRKRGLRAHPLLYLGMGMMVMLALWQGLTAFGAWWQLHQDDATYGRPRTYQFDAVVGHSDSQANPTHFILINLNRHILIIEFPGGDPSHARIYAGPTLFGDGQDLTPVTGKALDVNGDGKPDLVLFVQDQRIVFINDGTQFRPLKPGEHITIPQS